MQSHPWHPLRVGPASGILKVYTTNKVVGYNIQTWALCHLREYSKGQIQKPSKGGSGLSTSSTTTSILD